jgi:hypothetical protein
VINNSYLLGLYSGSFSTGGSLTPATASALAAARKKQPTPPWDAKAAPPAPDAQLRAALAGRRLIDENAARIDLNGASADYRKLFALYQGLDVLNALTNRAATKGLGAADQALIARRFASGLSEIGDYLAAARFEDVRVVQGVSASTSKSSAAVARDAALSITGPVHEGSPDAAVAAFAGPVVFDITLKRQLGDAVVSIDLAEMGADTRSLTNVIGFINGRLEAAGVETRFGRQQLKAEPRTIQVGGKPVTLPAGPDRWALAIRGVSTETVAFSAPAAADAVYVVQEAGVTGGAQLLKFQSDSGGVPPPAAPRIGETHWVDGRAGQAALPDGVEAVRASATGPDGSLWIVADLSAGPANQPIKGQGDVALMRFDSAGRLVTTQALGAAATASGYAIAVAADGRVAVAGSVIGALEPGKTGDDPLVADSFVSVFAADGQEQWTQRRGARAADEATAVAFGPNGTVQVAGRARSAMPGAASIGGWDGYLQTFSETQAHIYAPVAGAAGGVSQFGTGGDDAVQAMAVDGSDLYTAGVEDGRLIVRRFTLDGQGTPTLSATRDLGLASGEVAGVSVAGGRVVVAGATRNATLDVGTVTRAHAGGTDAFVVSLQTDLGASVDDRLTYLGGAGDDSAADIKVHDGKVWLTGVSDRPEAAKPTDPTKAYLSRIDPTSGAVEWTRTWSGDGDQARPLTLAVAAGGASVLDRLGLPKGEIDQSQSKRLIDATSLRAGDRFSISPDGGGRSVTVTIEARDTLQTLARKIEQASGTKLKVTVLNEKETSGAGADLSAVAAGLQRLSITARDGKAGAVLHAGEAGRDALAALGLSPGFIGAAAGDDGLKTFGLDLPRGLALTDAESRKTAGARLQGAMKAVRDAYRALAPESASAKSSGPVPAYLTAQLSNYQAALARLGG